MTAVKNAAGTALASYIYDSRSRRTTLTTSTGRTPTTTTIPPAGSLRVDNQTQDGHHKYAYDYDKVGNRMSMTVTHNNNPPETHAYTYDAIYQITGVDYPDGFDENLATDTDFYYDDAGNRTSVIDGSGNCTYTPNNLNQYTQAGNVAYLYDNSGNMQYDGHYVYKYDPENRLTKVKKQPQGPGALSLACDTDLVFTTGGTANWSARPPGATTRATAPRAARSATARKPGSRRP